MGIAGLRLTSPVRLALIGVGAWGRRYAETISRRLDCVVSGYARSSESHGPANLPGGFKIFYRDADEALRHCLGPSGPDGVIISTYPDLHAKLAREAALMGVPALIEKPLGMIAEDTKRVIRTAEAIGEPYVLLVNFIHLYSPAYLALKKRAEELLKGGLEIWSIVTEGTNNGPFRIFSTFLDYAPHDLSMVFDLLGPEKPFYVYESRRLPNSEGGEIWESHTHVAYTCVTMRVGNGAVKKTRRFEVVFSNGTRLMYDDGTQNKLTENGKPLPYDVSVTPLDEVVSAFVGGIRSRRETRQTTSNLSLAARVSMSIDALRRKTP